MQKLADGVHVFREQYFTKNKQLFRRLVDLGQEPETLFITCADSRVVPSLITNTDPGELFTVRNIGNLVPALSMPGGTAAAIQYAIEVLNVKNVVVCGHTHCGAVEAVFSPERLTNLKYVEPWLKQMEKVREVVQTRYAHLEGTAKFTAAAEENVLFQLEHLRAFKFIADRLDAGKLLIAGWMYKIETGDVFEYDPAIGQFVDISTVGSVLPPEPPENSAP